MSAARSASDSAPGIFMPFDLADRQKLNHNGLLGQRVDEPRRDDLHFIHFALQKQIAGKSCNRPGLGEPRRVAEGELRDQLPAGARDELCRPLPGGDEQGRRGIKLAARRNRLLLSAPHRPLSVPTRITARLRTSRTSSSGWVKSRT